jgi:hypothetical protein
MNDQKQGPSTNGLLSHDEKAELPAQRRLPEPIPVPSHPFPHLDQRAANRRTLRMVLLLMTAMALLGLLLALWTVPIRRANDTKARPPSQRLRSGLNYTPPAEFALATPAVCNNPE